MELQSLNLVCTKSITQPRRAGKAPRDVYVITGQTQVLKPSFVISVGISIAVNGPSGKIPPIRSSPERANG